MCLHFNFYFVTLTENKATTRRTQEQGTPCPPSALLIHLVSTSRTARPVLTSASFCVPWTFLNCFFTPCLIGILCTYTNDYANTVGPQKPSLYQSWSNTYPEEFYPFIGLLMYTSIVLVKQIPLPWFVGMQLYG